jgi:hypothetical protein
VVAYAGRCGGSVGEMVAHAWDVVAQLGMQQLIGDMVALCGYGDSVGIGWLTLGMWWLTLGDVVAQRGCGGSRWGMWWLSW